MRHRFLRRLQPLLLAAAAVLFAPAIAAAPLSFQATIKFSEQVFPSSTPCYLMGTITGTGTANKIGALTVTSTDCINPLPPTYTSSFGFASHNVVLRTSNGDELWATYAGILSLIEGTITGSYVVYGGTGRFSHAVGAGTLRGFEVIQDTGVGNGELTLHGVLTY